MMRDIVVDFDITLVTDEVFGKQEVNRVKWRGLVHGRGHCFRR